LAVASVVGTQRVAAFRRNFVESFGFENSTLANCAQLPRYWGHYAADRGFVDQQTTGDVLMQKKILALAVAGALAPAAAMAQSTVEIYGRANLGIDNWRASGAVSPTGSFDSRNRIFDGSSRVGFRVNEGLGGGMRAFVVIETGVSIDSGNNAGQGLQPNTSAGFWASRDSYVGLGGGWGDVRFGRQSIFWSNGIIAQTGANYINTAADSVITGHMVPAPVTRQSNTMSYNTPTFGGFNASLSYSPSDAEAGSAFRVESDTVERGSIWGATGRFTTGAIRAQLDFAKRFNATNVKDRDITGIKGGVGFAYAPGSQISGILGRYEADAALVPGIGGAPTDDAKVVFWLLNWEHMMGQVQLLAQFYRANDVKVGGSEVSDSEVSAWTFGAKYFLSKRTGVYASLNLIRNGDMAWADHTGGAYTSGPLTAANRGADPRILAVGVMHNF
jgi:predicted porin